MKAKLRAGKTGAKGIVKKYADGGMTTPMGGANPFTIRYASAADMPTSASSPATGSSAFSGTAPFNLNTLLGAGSGSATGSPPTQSALQSLSGSAMGRPQTPPPMVGPRGFGPNDGGPSPGMGPKGPGMGRPGMGRPGMGRHDMDHHHGMGRPGTGGPMPQQMPVGGGMRPYGAPAASPVNVKPMTAGASVMPEGRAFKKGGMVGCDWSPKSSATMRGAARKGK